MFILSNTMRNLARHGRKSVLYCAICIAAVLAMQVYLAGIDSTEAQLRRLPEAIPISARVTNQIGSRFGGLQIHERIVDGLLASDNVKELLLATQLRAGLGEFAPEESRQRLQFNVMGANTIGALGKRVGDGAEWLSGYSPDFLLGNDAVCLADRGIMEALGLKLGDSIPLNLYYYKHSAMGSSLTFAPLELLQFRIVAVADLGIVSADMAAPSLVIPIETHSDICHRQGVDFTAASASFFVRDALLLNEFKAEMKANWLTPISFDGAAGMAQIQGRALMVNDATFISAALRLQETMSMLRGFLPVVVVALALIGYLVAFLMVQSRREEYAVYRLLGMGRGQCLAAFFSEMAILTVLGGVCGVLAAMLLDIGGLATGAPVFALFAACFLLGGIVALWRLGRTNVMLALALSE